jgi:hypothetical protein
MKPAALTATVFLSLVAALHFVRVAFQVSVTADGIEFPMWASGAGALLIAALAVWLWREQRL